VNLKTAKADERARWVGVFMTGYLVAVPFAFATVAMIWWTRHSDVTHERVLHVACPATVGGLSLIGAAYVGNPVLAAVALTICAMGVYAALTTFWTLPTGFLTGSAAAGAIALINSIGNIGGFVGPYAIGWIKDATGEITSEKRQGTKSREWGGPSLLLLMLIRRGLRPFRSGARVEILRR
jgi:MFS family permease